MPTYQLKTYKAWNGRSDEGQFSNSYEFQSNLAVDSPELAAQVTAFVDAVERPFMLQRTHFMRAVVATYGKEGRNPPPGTFVTIPLVGTGQRPIVEGQQAVALDVCLAIKWSAAGGRSGRTLFRGALLESEVEESGGKFVLSPVGTIADMNNIIPGFMGAANHLPIGIGARPAANNSAVRVFSAGGVAGVTILKRHRRRKKKPGETETGNAFADGLISAAEVILNSVTGAVAQAAIMSLIQKAAARGALTTVATRLPMLLAALEEPPVG